MEQFRAGLLEEADLAADPVGIGFFGLEGEFAEETSRF
jgi:hypothetical protein